jgi:hypothetical protein
MANAILAHRKTLEEKRRLLGKAIQAITDIEETLRTCNGVNAALFRRTSRSWLCRTTARTGKLPTRGSSCVCIGDDVSVSTWLIAGENVEKWSPSFGTWPGWSFLTEALAVYQGAA